MKKFVKWFLVAEACLVVFPCALWWGVMWCWPFPAGRILYKISFYFLPAAFCVRSGFGNVTGIMMPRGALGWLAVVGTYTLLSLAIALIALGIQRAGNKGPQNKPSHHTA